MCCLSSEVGQEKKENVGGNGWSAIDRSFHLEGNYPIPTSISNFKLVLDLDVSPIEIIIRDQNRAFMLLSH